MLVDLIRLAAPTGSSWTEPISLRRRDLSRPAQLMRHFAFTAPGAISTRRPLRIWPKTCDSRAMAR